MRCGEEQSVWFLPFFHQVILQGFAINMSSTAPPQVPFHMLIEGFGAELQRTLQQGQARQGQGGAAAVEPFAQLMQQFVGSLTQQAGPSGRRGERRNGPAAPEAHDHSQEHSFAAPEERGRGSNRQGTTSTGTGAPQELEALMADWTRLEGRLGARGRGLPLAAGLLGTVVSDLIRQSETQTEEEDAQEDGDPRGRPRRRRVRRGIQGSRNAGSPHDLEGPSPRDLEAAFSGSPTDSVGSVCARDLPEPCSICQEQIEIGQRMRTLPCFHFLHEECAERFAQAGRGPNAHRQLRCPVCREGWSFSDAA